MSRIAEYAFKFLMQGLIGFVTSETSHESKDSPLENELKTKFEIWEDRRIEKTGSDCPAEDTIVV